MQLEHGNENTPLYIFRIEIIGKNESVCVCVRATNNKMYLFK